MLELVYRMVSKTIALSGLRVQVPSPVLFNRIRFVADFLLYSKKPALIGGFLVQRRLKLNIYFGQTIYIGKGFVGVSKPIIPSF